MMVAEKTTVFEPEQPPVIETSDLHKIYTMGDEKIHALAGVSMCINRGEMVAIMGPSGCGKSTLMSILGALDKPTSGIYKLDGVEIGEMSDDRLSDIRNNRIGFVFQKFNLLARSSALENVALPLVYAGMPAKMRRERAEWAMEVVDLKTRMKHKPNELSGGQQQRVAIARALANAPALLLCDEPTGSLDSESSATVMNALREVQRSMNTTVIIVTHSMDVASEMDRLITLVDGHLESDVDPHSSAQMAAVKMLKEKRATGEIPMTRVK